jgi:sialate O-acetylesterase
MTLLKCAFVLLLAALPAAAYTEGIDYPFGSGPGLDYPGPYPAGGSCNFHGPKTICIGAPVSDNAVLQRAPAKSAVTGSVPEGYGEGPMTVTVTLVDAEDAGGFNQSIDTVVRPDNTWKAFLPPRPTFGNYSLTAVCTKGCAGDNATAVASLVNLTFGDVYVCAGQSNMQLMMEYTFDNNKSIDAIKQGKYKNIRLFYGPMNFAFTSNRTDIWVINADQAGDPVNQRNKLNAGGWRYPENLVETIPDGHNEKPWFLSTEFGRMYATCWYTFEALTDSLIAAGETPPPFGLMGVAVGGTKIAQWVEWDAQGECKNVTCCEGADCTQSPQSNPHPYIPVTHTDCPGNAQLYNGLIAPLVNTTIKGWLWYQGENSLCYDAGSYPEKTGYACMMAKLISSWRKIWSVEPGTTDPMAPYQYCTPYSCTLCRYHGSDGIFWAGEPR